MNTLLTMLAPLVIFLFFPNAHSASFDCAKASSKVEHLICSDSRLSTQDERLSAAYKTAMKNTGNLAFLRQEQKQWLLQRNECIDIPCLVHIYDVRTIELLSPRPDWPARSISTADKKACQIVAEHLNRNSLKLLFINPDINEPSSQEIVSIFGDGASLGNYWSLDLNNDGIKDQLLILVDGSAHFTSVFARSGKKDAIPTSMGTNFEESAIDNNQFDPLSSADILRADERAYIFDGYKLWNLTENGKFQAVCQFEEKSKPLTVITTGNSNPVCITMFADEKEIKRVPFVLENGLGEPLPDEDRFQMIERGQDIVGARVDIDNDGNVENVVRLVRFFPGGRTCSASILAESDSNASHIPDTQLNNLLLNELGSDPCGPSLDLLIHNGVTYVEAIYNSISNADPLDRGGRMIYRIEKNMAKPICETRTRVNVKAVGVRVPR